MHEEAANAAWPLSVGRALEMIADRWTASIIRDAFIGPFRFDELCESLDISRHTLSRRLTYLVDQQILEKRPYQERPVRYEYLLSTRGEELYGIFVAIKRWGDRWVSAAGDPEVRLWHSLCDHEVVGRVVCESCGEELRVIDMEYAVISPGSRDAPRRKKKGRGSSSA